MFSYKVIKHEDTENGTLFGLYETTTDEDGTVLVMGNAPLNQVFYESVDELVEHITDVYHYIQEVKAGSQTIVGDDAVTFVDMEQECDEDCDCGNCGTEEGSDKSGCACGGNCGCNK